MDAGKEYKSENCKVKPRNKTSQQVWQLTFAEPKIEDFNLSDILPN